jgi:hypothetical protein
MKSYHISNLAKELGSVISQEVALVRFSGSHAIRWSYTTVSRYSSGANASGEVMNGQAPAVALRDVETLVAKGFVVDSDNFALLKQDARNN